ncbi:CheR family methyltransferase [Cohnella caldifontis]|uniref:CheR family methyltransferase n=1 Tax=Cohnella caldifontis TaxID=3027471 RepID=UPI0023EC74C2|nr:protein-glutamate O-methyltransferase CheR [Cohnella sp. YIM B05605]
MGEAGTNPQVGFAEDDADFARFVEDIRKLTSIDLSLYKENQMRRRLTTLRLKHGFSAFSAYYEALARDPKLLGEFLDRMTINVSEFWRNPNRWQMLKERFLEPMAQRPGRLLVWSAACSTGEEPYTLAMLLDSLGALERTTLLATDIDETVLAKAKEGAYADRSMRDVPQEYLLRYFRQENGMYRVTDKLKQAVRFQRQNLLLDPFPDRYDLIVCRNVMIYFTEEAKSGLYRKFAQALKPGGILFVGSTEQIFSPGQYGLEAADTFFYRRADAGV